MADEPSPQALELAERLWEHALKDKAGRVTIVLDGPEDLARWMEELGKAARLRGLIG